MQLKSLLINHHDVQPQSFLRQQRCFSYEMENGKTLILVWTNQISIIVIIGSLASGVFSIKFWSLLFLLKAVVFIFFNVRTSVRNICLHF